MTDADALRFANIRIDSESIAVIDGRRVALEASAPDVQSIQLTRGVPSHRPMATAIVGVVLFAFSFLPVPMLIGAVLGISAFRPSLVAVIGFAIPAWYLVKESVVAQNLLLVTTSRGTRKFPVGSEQTADIEVFLASAKARFPWLEAKA